MLLDESLPWPEWLRVMDVRLILNEVLNKRRASRPAIDPSTQLGIQSHRPIQQQGRSLSVAEMTRIHERFVHRCETVGVGIQENANAVDVAQSRQKLERSGK